MQMFKLEKISYANLNSRQKEIYNFQKVAALLADYGYNCIKLSDDWNNADFIACHANGGDTLKVQLKSRLTIDKKYIDKGLYIAFFVKRHNKWYLVAHDYLVKEVDCHTTWLTSSSWTKEGSYHSDSPNTNLLQALAAYEL